MILQIKKLSKKYNRDWILRNLDYSFKGPGIYAVKGPNGSGKSTLLKILAGYTAPSNGELIWQNENSDVSEEERYKYLTVSAPYMQLVEELTLDEFLVFHNKFKELKANQSFESFKQKTGLAKQGNKAIKDFSSGMKQRVKLGLCFYFKSDVVLIDEGSSNLDKSGIEWFQEEVKSLSDQLVILFSNQEVEYSLATESLEFKL